MKRFSSLGLALLAAIISTTALSAQEHTTVSVMVKKDGKVTTDTTYRFEDPDQAEHALKMMEAMSGVDAKHMVFISEDGTKTELEGISGDSIVWIHEGDHVKVIKHSTVEGHPCHYQMEKVVIIEEGDGEWETVEKGDMEEKEVEVIVIKKKQ